MSFLETLLLLGLLLFLSGVFSGSETGFYALSRLRVEAEARQGRWAARLVRFLIRGEAGLLITLLIGNNLCLELLTHISDDRISRLEAVPAWSHELLAALLLTPVVFLFGELVPKDVFLRRADTLFGLFAPLIALARAAFLPLAWPIRLFAGGLERLFGVKPAEFTRALGREEVLEFLREGARSGALAPHAEELALNVLELRKKKLRDIIVPWSAVQTLDLDAPEEERRRSVLGSDFSRIPVLRTRADGARQVVGYVLQLDCLGDPRPVSELVRNLPRVSPDLPVDTGLARLRLEGQRIALVGEPDAPAGIVTLKDLVQTISGDLGGW